MRQVMVLLSLIACAGCKTNTAPSSVLECGNLDRTLSAFEVYIERNELEAEEGEEGECLETCAALITCLQDEACVGDNRTDPLGDFHCQQLCGCQADGQLKIPQCAQLAQAAGYEHTPICDIATQTAPEMPTRDDAGVEEEDLCCALYRCINETCPAEYPGASCNDICNGQLCRGQETFCRDCDFTHCPQG